MTHRTIEQLVIEKLHLDNLIRAHRIIDVRARIARFVLAEVRLEAPQRRALTQLKENELQLNIQLLRPIRIQVRIDDLLTDIEISLTELEVHENYERYALRELVE